MNKESIYHLYWLSLLWNIFRFSPLACWNDKSCLAVQKKPHSDSNAYRKKSIYLKQHNILAIPLGFEPRLILLWYLQIPHLWQVNTHTPFVSHSFIYYSQTFNSASLSWIWKTKGTWQNTKRSALQWKKCRVRGNM